VLRLYNFFEYLRYKNMIIFIFIAVDNYGCWLVFVLFVGRVCG